MYYTTATTFDDCASAYLHYDGRAYRGAPSRVQQSREKFYMPLPLLVVTRQFWEGEGEVVYFEPPPSRNFIATPLFCTPPHPKKGAFSGGWGCIKFGLKVVILICRTSKRPQNPHCTEMTKKAAFQRTPWGGGGKKRGEENLTKDTPPKIGFGPLFVWYVFHPPLVSLLWFSCTEIHD